MAANDRQIGGTHYRTACAVQHWDWVMSNGLEYAEGCASKYLTRWRQKDGLQDLRKAEHFISKMFERVPLGLAPVPFAQFAQANAIPPRERYIIRLLSMYRTSLCSVLLIEARCAVNELIAEAEEEEYDSTAEPWSRGYVYQ